MESETSGGSVYSGFSLGMDDWTMADAEFDAQLLAKATGWLNYWMMES